MKSIFKNKNIIGSDETGVGDYLTPLVAAAVFVKYNQIKLLEEIGVEDSKNLSDDKIVDMSFKIKKIVTYAIRHLSQTGYNKLNERYNANELKMFLHMSCINSIESKIDKYDLVLIDQFSTEKSISKYYNKLSNSNFDLNKFRNEIILLQKAESEHVAVAAASILARADLVFRMKEQNKKYGMIFPFGTNPKVENVARTFVKKHGKDKLGEVAKLSFKTTNKII